MCTEFKCDYLLYELLTIQLIHYRLNFSVLNYIFVNNISKYQLYMHSKLQTLLKKNSLTVPLALVICGFSQ